MSQPTSSDIVNSLENDLTHQCELRENDIMIRKIEQGSEIFIK